jgi:hypothetical protein
MRAMSWKHVVKTLVAVAAAGVAGCSGETEPAGNIGGQIVDLKAKAGAGPGESGQLWFEYRTKGTSTWISTIHRSWSGGSNPKGISVEERLRPDCRGLAACTEARLKPGTTYEYRICTTVRNSAPRCQDSDPGPDPPTTYDTFTTEGPLTWAPPTLASPVVVNVPAEEPAPQDGLYLIDGGSQDCKVNLPAVPITFAVKTLGCNDIEVIGGEINLSSRWQDDGAPGCGAENREKEDYGLFLQNWSGTAHVEGLKLTGAGLSDGVDFASGGGPNPNATIQIENVWVDTLHPTDDDPDGCEHPDSLQTWQGPDVIRLDKITTWSNFQGINVDSNALFAQRAEGSHERDRASAIRIKRTNVRLDTGSGNGTACFAAYSPYLAASTSLYRSHCAVGERQWGSAMYPNGNWGNDYDRWWGTGTAEAPVTRGLVPGIKNEVAPGEVGVAYPDPGEPGHPGYAPTTPNNVAAVAGSCSLAVTWQAVSNAERYEVRSARYGSPWDKATYVGGTEQQSSIHADRQAGRVYLAQVRGVNTQGPGPWSAIAAARPNAC